ncbi:hypothetical protein A3H40_02615 [Candidatus Daviesbacteria bacterium RIFCSPLOWO2_02_FULL_38_15]|uniref:Response regulatory domain-containing protein n=1 Tax=Candidatus Daviesbacteria bacterium RIFCSPLOWO2_02_FULL_38_15 TaxID=1797794 RepID=A0A1F5N4Z0_9BACT|nr:MAG: hypothetical protein A3H40_02615 [Candidatus Daviesbacteria bacterium RIFCSPLOWO2_02_FULL_38_15]
MESIQTKTILLVEDDQISGRMYQNTFLVHGIECTLVATGEEAFEKLKNFLPDLILLDVKLENSIDGFTILEMIKKDSKLQKIPVWLLTNIWETGNREKGVSLGAEDFIGKTNILPLDLVKKVKKRLGLV